MLELVEPYITGALAPNFTKENPKVGIRILPALVSWNSAPSVMCMPQPCRRKGPSAHTALQQHCCRLTYVGADLDVSLPCVLRVAVPVAVHC